MHNKQGNGCPYLTILLTCVELDRKPNYRNSHRGPLTASSHVISLPVTKSFDSTVLFISSAYSVSAFRWVMETFIY